MDDVRHPFMEICERLLIEADEIVGERRRVLRIMESRRHGNIRKVLVFSLQGAIQRRDVMVLGLQPCRPLRLEDGAVFAVQTQRFVGKTDGMDGLAVFDERNDDAEVLFDDGAGLGSVDAVSEEAACAFLEVWIFFLRP